MVKLDASTMNIGVDSKTMQYAIQNKVGELFEDAHNFGEMSRIMHNEMAEYHIGFLRTASYWHVYIVGIDHQFDTFGEAFKFALDAYVKKEIEQRLASP